MDRKTAYCFCPEYNREMIFEKIEQIFSEFPSFENKLKAKPGAKVLIKPNLLAARHPEKAVTTHPEILAALIQYLQKFDCKILIADSPAGVYNKKILETLYETCGLNEVAKETGAELNFDTSETVMPIPDAKVFKKVHIITPAVEADFIINVPKLKTHGLTRLTCASKNLFGLMPGILKYRQHVIMPDINVFSQMIADINSLFEEKTFTIVDGIMGMEGEGPSSGTPRFAGALFGGINTQVVDVLACKIMGMPPETVPTILNFKNFGDIEIKEFDEIRTYDFKLPPVRNRSIPESIPKWIQNLLTDFIVAKPVINKKLCKKCRVCEEACPAQVILTEETGAKIKDYKACIKCYCCQEICPHKAIKLSKPLAERVYRIFRKK